LQSANGQALVDAAMTKNTKIPMGEPSTTKVMKRITVLLAEDHSIVREGLRSLLELGGDFEVVGEATNGREAVELTRKLRPAVVVMDIAMPVLNGFEATRQILLAAPGTKVLVLSAHSDDEYVARMAAVGASGYLVKQNSGQVLVRAIREIASGHPYFSASILKRLRDAERKARERGDAGAKPQQTLTAREAEVLQLVAEGAPNKQVAAKLGISIKTVEKHRQQLMDKLDIHDTAGLTRHAIATGVIESSIQVTTD
jgi:DNA-binding NarL/FixJ family response regulator